MPLILKDIDPRCHEMGARLAQERIARNFKRQELARRAGVSDSYIGTLETGNTQYPNAQGVLSLCSVLNLNPRWLVYGEGNKHPDKEPVAPPPLQIERMPVELSRCLLKLVEEMQNARLYARDNLVEAHHLDRWLGTLLEQPQLAALRDHLLRMPDESEAVTYERPTVATVAGQHMPMPSSNVSVLSDRRMSVQGDPIDKAAKVARLTVPPVERSPSAPAAPVEVKFSLDYLRGDKLGLVKKGNYTHNLILKAKQRRKDGRLRILDVCGALGISTASFHLYKSTDADFPAPVLGKDGQACYERKDVEKYLALKIMERRQAAP